jgi:signal transduction histidine kinase/CheY-like chemotaxis protein
LERKLAEDALKQSAYAADAANRAKSEFLSRMSHELRTPLNAILGFTQVMNHNPSLSSEEQEHLGIISRSGEHLLELINDILEMSKIESGRVTLNETSFDLYNLLDTLKQMFQLKAKFKGIELSFERPSDIPQYVKTDESKLRQVLINLLSNAIKFTEAGSVTLRVRAAEGESGKVREDFYSYPETVQQTFPPSPRLPLPSSPPPLVPPSPHLFFELEDTGSGIAPEEMHLLFVPFEQTETGRKSQQGTGLGLSLTRQFVQLMGGDITVSSTVGKGTIVKFDVPLGLSQPHEIQTSQRTCRVIALAPEEPNYRILVVDDVKSSRLLLVKLLASTGFEVYEAINGLDAIALWESWQPHLILMDMMMPVMDGYEATKRIKAQVRRSLAKRDEVQNGTKFEATPVIIALTANAFEEDKAVILAAGCDDFVSKPFQEETIFEKIAQHLGVRYLYEQKEKTGKITDENASLAPSDFTLHPSSLEVMPAEWRSQLYRAAASGSDCLIFQLIEQIPSTHAPLRNILADWVNDFRFERVIDLIQQVQN